MVAVYHCGYSNAWSSLYTFTAMPAGSNWSPRFAVFGDMGNVNAQSVGRLQEETQAGHFDAVLHVGGSPSSRYHDFITVVITVIIVIVVFLLLSFVYNKLLTVYDKLGNFLL